MTSMAMFEKVMTAVMVSDYKDHLEGLSEDSQIESIIDVKTSQRPNDLIEAMLKGASSVVMFDVEDAIDRYISHDG